MLLATPLRKAFWEEDTDKCKEGGSEVPKYNFYYDETEHSRSLGLRTIVADEFYDGFVTAIVGWDERDEKDLEARYVAFEERYRSPGASELKSTSLNKRQFRYGFHSLGKANVRMLADFFELFDANKLVYYSFSSKVEILIYRLFSQCRGMPGACNELLQYSLAKLVVQYKPRKVVEAFYGNPSDLIEAVRDFLSDRIERNAVSPVLKGSEIVQCTAIMAVLDRAMPLDNSKWEYKLPFAGFARYLDEHPEIVDFDLAIDREERTAEAAKELGFSNVRQVDSVDCFGVRVADMLAGIVGKMLKGIREELTYHSPEEEVEKRLFDKKWFEIDDSRLNLYKKLRRILIQTDRCWYKAYGTTYSDDLIVLIALLNYFSNFNNSEELREKACQHAEAFNTCCCMNLQQFFEMVALGAR